MDISGQVESTQTIALLRSARIVRRVPVTLGDWLSLKLQRETIRKTFKGVTIINCKWRPYRDTERINYISECGKLTQK